MDASTSLAQPPAAPLLLPPQTISAPAQACEYATASTSFAPASRVPSHGPTGRPRAKKAKAASVSAPSEADAALLARRAEEQAALAAAKAARDRQRAQDALLPTPPPPDAVVVNTLSGLREALAGLSQCNVFGMDTETRPVFVCGAPPEPPALLQIAGMWLEDPGGHAAPGGEPWDSSAVVPERVYLFDLLHLLPRFGDEFEMGLGGLMREPGRLFLGVGIVEDLRLLARAYGGCMPFLLGGLSDVQDIGFLQEEAARCNLRRLLARFAGYKLVKAQSTSNWARRPLTEAQILYATNDARAALMVYVSAGAEAFSSQPAEVNVGSVEIWACMVCGGRYLSFGKTKCQAACEKREKKEARLCKVMVPVNGEEFWMLEKAVLTEKKKKMEEKKKRVGQAKETTQKEKERAQKGEKKAREARVQN